MHFPNGNELVDFALECDMAEYFEAADVVELEPTQITTTHDKPMKTVDFPVTASLAALAQLEDGFSVEVATIGQGGFVEVDAVLHHEIALRTSICIFGGTAIRVPIDDFQRGIACVPAFADRVYQAVRARIFVTEQLLLCTARHSVDMRLARWLAAAADRTHSETVRITHDLLASMLGVRRAGVTTAAQELQATGAISLGRGAIEVTDRVALESAACECYRVCKNVLYPAD